MPLSEAHMAQIAKGINDHEAEIGILRATQAYVERAIATHETILRLARNAGLLKTLDSLCDDQELLDSLRDDPDAFFKERGFNAAVECHPRAAVKMCRYERSSPHGERHFTLALGPIVDTPAYSVVWDSIEGFSVVPIEE